MRGSLRWTRYAAGIGLLIYGGTCASQTIVHVQSTGPCATNTIIMPAGSPVSRLKVEKDADIPAAGASTTGPVQPCLPVERDHVKLNALEAAQLRILEWEHRPKVTYVRSVLAYRLGETTASLWGEISNDSPYDASELRSNDFQAKPTVPKPARRPPQVFRKPSDPDVVFIDARGAPLPGSTHVLLELADANALRKLGSDIPGDYCLYDVSSRADDWSIEGYHDVGPAVSYGYRSIPVAYVFTMKDMFGQPLSLQMTAFLRFAPRATQTIFHPSSMKYDDLRCWPLQPSAFP